MTPYAVLGYVVARGTLGTHEATVLIAAGVNDDGDVESTWSHDDEHALLLPSRTAAVMLACAIGAGDAQILTTVQERPRMTKREIRRMAEEFADRFAAIVDNAGWKRRKATHAEPKTRAKRVGARAKR